jgi:hypothetical protein
MSIWLTSNSFWGVFWIDVGSESTAKNDFLRVANALGSPVENVDEARQALANSKKRWLLVLDNADDVYFDYKRYIPSGMQGAIIVTSRNPQCSRYSTVAAEALEGLDVEHSTLLLLKAARVPEEAWHSCEMQAHDIVSLLGSHTLALIQAGAYVAEGFCRLAEYPKRYEQHRRRLLEHHPDQEQSRYRDVFATFEASADALERSGRRDGRDALDLLAVLCLLHSGVLPLGMFEDAWLGARRVLKTVPAETDGTEELHTIYWIRPWHVAHLPEFVNTKADEWDDYRLKNARKRLLSLSLVTRHALGDGGGDGGLSMHPLAHAWAKDRLEKEQQQQAWIMAGCVLALSHRQTDLWRVCERDLRPHVQSFLSPSVQTMLLCGPQKAVLAILLRCGWVLNTMREDARLEQLLNSIYQALHIIPSDPTTEHVAIWELAARNVGYTGHAREAVELLEHIVKIKKSTLDEHHLDLLASQHALACAYGDNGQITDAVELLKHVVKIRETTLIDERHPSLLASQHALAMMYLKNRQITEAVELLKHVVKIRETTLIDERHPSLLISQSSLVVAYFMNGQVKDAVQLLEHVVKVEKVTLSETDPDRLASEKLLSSWQSFLSRRLDYEGGRI